MSKILKTWTVLPHGALEEVDEGIISVSGDIAMPLGNFPRRMTVVGLSGARSAIFSALALPESEMSRIESLGRPAALIVPNGGHRLDAGIWKQRYPNIRVLAPPGARDAVSEVVPVDSTADSLDDPDCRFLIVPGTDRAESALLVRRSGGVTLICNDIIGHVRHPRGIGAHVMVRLFGYGLRQPAIPRTARRYIKEPAALARQLRDWAQVPQLKRIIVSHGEIITQDPAAALCRLADQLEERS